MPILTTVLVAAQAFTLPAPSSRVCSAIQVVAPEQDRANRKRTFSARQTLDLELRAKLRPRLSGDHLLRLKLFTPRGFLYQEITVPFRPDTVSRRGGRTSEDQATRVVPGYPRPLPVQTARRKGRGSRRHHQITARLPVAGTSISLGSLFGRWTVVPYLDDGTAPCGPARKFVIRE